MYGYPWNSSYASYLAHNLRRLLKTHVGSEKRDKINCVAVQTHFKIGTNAV